VNDRYSSVASLCGDISLLNSFYSLEEIHKIIEIISFTFRFTLNDNLRLTSVDIKLDSKYIGEWSYLLYFSV